MFCFTMLYALKTGNTLAKVASHSTGLRRFSAALQPPIYEQTAMLYAEPGRRRADHAQSFQKAGLALRLWDRRGACQESRFLAVAHP